MSLHDKSCFPLRNKTQFTEAKARFAGAAAIVAHGKDHNAELVVIAAGVMLEMLKEMARLTFEMRD